MAKPIRKGEWQMARHAALAGSMLLALFLVGPASPASAQTAGTRLHQFDAQSWFARGSGAAGPWSSTLWRLSYGSVSDTSRVGVQADYIFGGARGESFLTLGLTYRLPVGVFRGAAAAPATPVDRGFAARTILRYGSFSFNIPGGRAASAGVGLGSEWTILLPQQPGGGRLAIVADYVRYFSNATTAPLGTGPGPASTYSIALVFKPARRTAQGPAPGWHYASTQSSADLLGAEWGFTAGGRGSTVEIAAGSSYSWTGFFIGLSKTF